MELTDGVVTLRPPVVEDAPAVADAVQSSLTTLSPWLPWATPGYSALTALGWVESNRAADVHQFVVRDASDVVVGACGLQGADLGNRCVQLGYWVAQPHERRGHATRAARLLVDHATEALAFHRVEMLISVDNTASQRVAERLGAQLEARLSQRLRARYGWHDAFLYSVVAASA